MFVCQCSKAANPLLQTQPFILQQCEQLLLQVQQPQPQPQPQPQLEPHPQPHHQPQPQLLQQEPQSQPQPQQEPQPQPQLGQREQWPQQEQELRFRRQLRESEALSCASPLLNPLSPSPSSPSHSPTPLSSSLSFSLSFPPSCFPAHQVQNDLDVILVSQCLTDTWDLACVCVAERSRQRGRQTPISPRSSLALKMKCNLQMLYVLKCQPTPSLDQKHQSF